MIVDHNHPKYRRKFEMMKSKKVKNCWNGAFYYSKEITKYFIPNIKTDRNWVTLNVPGEAFDHSIIFIHNNLHPQNYDWLKDYKDLILVCGVPETMEKVAHLGTPLYLPLSVDVNYVKKFECTKSKGAAFVGRRPKRKGIAFPPSIDILENLPRTRLLLEMTKYYGVYAVGRTAIEARILNCKILPYDSRFPDPGIWKVVDSMEAVDILQKKLDEIERSKK